MADDVSVTEALPSAPCCNRSRQGQEGGQARVSTGGALDHPRWILDPDREGREGKGEKGGQAEGVITGPLPEGVTCHVFNRACLYCALLVHLMMAQGTSLVISDHQKYISVN